MKSRKMEHPGARRANVRTPSIILLAALLVAGPALFVAPGAVAEPSPQSVEGTQLQIQMNQEARGLREIGLWIGPLRLRMDQTANQMSLLWIGGEGGSMSMVMHPEKMYMQYSMEDVERMLGQTRAQAQAESAEEAFGSPPRFVATGNTKTVGAWNASEYGLEGPEDTPDVIFWFSQDAGAELRPVVEQLVAAIDALNTPALRRISGGMPDGGLVAHLNASWDEMGVPPGFPVEIVTSEGGTLTTITVVSIEQGALDAADFEPPDGYQRMQMPIRR